MRKKNYLTVIIQPDWKAAGKSVRRSRTFEIPTRIFYYIVVAAVLLVIFGIDGTDKASRNITGAEIVKFNDLSIDNLAPGGLPGRLILWTQSAFNELNKYEEVI